MPENKTYKANGQVYEIPESEVADFLKDFPDATEVNSFVMEKDTFDIPVNEVSSFIQDNPTAKALKKKDTPELGTSVGSESQSSGKSFQQLYQEHVTEGKEFVTPFDETPAGKVSKVDANTKKPVGAKKELANYELLYGDEYPELVQQKSLEIAEKTQWKPTLTEGENLQLQQARENVKAKEQDLQAYKEAGQINMSDKQDPLAVQKANDLAKEQKL